MVPLSGDTITVLVTPRSIILSIKVQIRDQTDIPTDQQRLMFKGNRLDWWNTMTECDINEESSLDFIVTTHFVCNVLVGWPSFDFIDLDVDLNDTVDSVKAKIYGKEGIPPHEQMVCKVEWYENNIIPKSQELEGCRTLGSQSINSEEPELILLAGPRP